MDASKMRISEGRIINGQNGPKLSQKIKQNRKIRKIREKR